ncbi:type 2 lanthipeptide synthetase LanM family protein [Saccharopolyspora sp. NPDC047091]|uniref:type 2 lanthipeptide synthetase LanM family protein n=1 Tax=Saccharopolyspora sp. NPDC047091 TaxID=3155924 RepID=UPI00340235F6
MQTDRALDLAARASNLDERLRVVTALRDSGRPPAAAPPDPVERWRLDRVAGRLAGKFAQEAENRAQPTEHTAEELAAALTAFRAVELDPTGPGLPELLEELHAAWLPTYRDAVLGWDPAHSDPRATWRDTGVYYGELATACEPFLVELGRRLEKVRAELPESIGPNLVDDLQRHLHGRFSLALAWVVEAEANLHRARRGLDRERAGEADYLAYLDATFSDAATYHAFFLEYPVLGRWLAHLTELVTDYGTELLRNLAADAAQLGAELFGRTIAEFRSLRLGNGDYHAGGRSVAVVTVELDDGETGTVYYKPRCLRSEAGVQVVLDRLRERDVVGFAARPVLVRDGYGYEAAIPGGRNETGSAEAAAHVYRELGGYLALFYVLGGSDLHFENIIVADGHAYVCDGETVFDASPLGRGGSGTVQDSVFKTGLLEWPRAESADGPEQMRLSGYTGGESYEIPMPIPVITGERLNFAATVRNRSGVRVELDATNRVFLHGELVHPQDHLESIMDGFDRVHEWLEHNADEAVALLSAAFDGASARFLNWSTQIYAQLLASARHPKCLADPIEVDLLLNTVRTFPRDWDRTAVLSTRETASMWRLDVPIFTVGVSDVHLVHDHAERLPTTLKRSPLDGAANRIRGLTAQDRARQARYIAASLSHDEISSPAFVATALDYAVRVGERLCSMMLEPGAAAPWKSFGRVDGVLESVDIDADLYTGTAGVALFLAYLDDLVPRPEFRQAARRALEHATGTPPQRTGAFADIGGRLYLLAHLHRLWGEQELVDRAVELCDGLPGLIDADTHLDVLHGAAGMIPVLLQLEPLLGDEALTLAHHCAAHLLSSARDRGDALSWPSNTPEHARDDMTGFAHGAAGIGWALVLLGTRTGREDYVVAGRRAFAYEARHFDTGEQDWYDLRYDTGQVAKNGHHFSNAWCNGAAGIGLSRIAAWALLGEDDEELLRESRYALGATVRNFPRLKNHTLCHGTSGNSELLLRYALLRADPAFRLEANVQVREMWRSLDDAEHGLGEQSADFFPGLMLGISGYGMHFLRIAHPDRIPSVLMLDPPPPRP